MYKIINVKDGSTVGSAEKIFFIKKKTSTGCYIQTDEQNAQGVAFNNAAIDNLIVTMLEV